MSVSTDAVPSHETIETAVKQLDAVLQRLPENHPKHEAREWLAQTEKAAHTSREIGDRRCDS